MSRGQHAPPQCSSSQLSNSSYSSPSSSTSAPTPACESPASGGAAPCAEPRAAFAAGPRGGARALDGPGGDAGAAGVGSLGEQLGTEAHQQAQQAQQILVVRLGAAASVRTRHTWRMRTQLSRARRISCSNRRGSSAAVERMRVVGNRPSGGWSGSYCRGSFEGDWVIAEGG